jgi:hypothetical protein
MMRFTINLTVSVVVILGATWLSKRQPTTAGFVAALPITTMLVLLLGRMGGARFEDQARFAQSLLVAIPLSATFLIPFVVAPRMGWSFWASFIAGVLLLCAGYAVHRWLFGVYR